MSATKNESATRLVRIRFPAESVLLLDAFRLRFPKQWPRASVIRALVGVSLALAQVDPSVLEPHLKDDKVKRGRAKGPRRAPTPAPLPEPLPLGAPAH